jgi:hypothetical protein
MLGLTIRWSLSAADGGVEQRLADFVADNSYDRFTGMAGLRWKTWRCVPGEWFEGTYVFATEEARVEFQRAFAETADQSPGTRIIGSSPILVEACDIVAVAEGADGFGAAPRW